MYCTICGNSLPDSSANCLNCGAIQGLDASSTPVGPNPDGWIIAGIFLSFCWCLPLGIVTLFFASRASGRLKAGDIEGALADTGNAKTWALVGFGLGVLIFGAYALLIFAGILSEL